MADVPAGTPGCDLELDLNHLQVAVRTRQLLAAAETVQKLTDPHMVQVRWLYVAWPLYHHMLAARRSSLCLASRVSSVLSLSLVVAHSLIPKVISRAGESCRRHTEEATKRLGSAQNRSKTSIG